MPPTAAPTVVAPTVVPAPVATPAKPAEKPVENQAATPTPPAKIETAEPGGQVHATEITAAPIAPAAPSLPQDEQKPHVPAALPVTVADATTVMVEIPQASPPQATTSNDDGPAHIILHRGKTVPAPPSDANYVKIQPSNQSDISPDTTTDASNMSALQAALAKSEASLLEAQAAMVEAMHILKESSGLAAQQDGITPAMTDTEAMLRVPGSQLPTDAGSV